MELVSRLLSRPALRSNTSPPIVCLCSTVCWMLFLLCPIRLSCPHSVTEFNRLKEMEEMAFLQTLTRFEVAVKVHPSDTQSVGR